MLRCTMKFMPSQVRSRAALAPFRSCEKKQLPLLPGIPQIVLNPYNCQIEYIGFHISIMIY